VNREVAAFVCSHIFYDTHPVLLVARENGDWMFLCGQVHGEQEEYHVVGVEHLLMRDPTMRALLDLTENSEAERPSRRGAWTRRALAPQ
jgi:hypothetical protein